MTAKAMTAGLVLALSLTSAGFAQQNPASTTDTAQKMSVNERMAKARAAKAEKKSVKATLKSDNIAQSGRAASSPHYTKAAPADYKAPVDKTQKGPNGEVVHTGERGGKYYINKNGNKTYLSSNQ